MAHFEVSANGTVFGIYSGETEQDARDACAVAAGHDSEDELIERLESPGEFETVQVEAWKAWVDGSNVEVEFFAPVDGNFDIAEAGARALGIEVSEELNVERV